MNQNRWRSKIAWATVVPIVILLGDTYGLWDVIGMPRETFTQLTVSVGAMLVAFGIFNNPTDKEGF